MNNSRSLTGKLRQIFSFQLMIFMCLAFCADSGVKAQDNAQSPASEQETLVEDDSSGLIDGVVADVQGTVIRTEAGAMIDVSKAFLLSIGGQQIALSSINAGMRIRASVNVPTDTSSPFVAGFLQVRLDNEIVLVGKVQEVDFLNNFIVILNRRILIDGATAIISKRGKLKVGRVVTVVARSDGENLLAARIHLDNKAALIGASLL